MKRVIFTIAALAIISSSAFAGVDPPPAQVPEPGTFGLFAMAAAALLITVRLKRRK